MCYCLRGRVQRKNPSYLDGFFYGGGDYYETRSITRDVLSCASSLVCTYWEVLTLELGIKLLQHAVNIGLKFRLRSRYSDTQIHAGIIQFQLTFVSLKLQQLKVIKGNSEDIIFTWFERLM